MNLYQKKQIEVVNQIESSLKERCLSFSTVSSVKDFENDPRTCLTSIHFLKPKLINQIYRLLINPLKLISPNHYYYQRSSLHMTIKGIRVINDPPHFNSEDIKKARMIFQETIPYCHQFKVFFYRLLLFPTNLSLIGTTEEERDRIAIVLDKKLGQAGIPDDKKYLNSRFFFSNITLARFDSPISNSFRKKVKALSGNISKMFKPYTVDSVSLVSGNAVLKNRKIFGQWLLK